MDGFGVGLLYSTWWGVGLVMGLGLKLLTTPHSKPLRKNACTNTLFELLINCSQGRNKATAFRGRAHRSTTARIPLLAQETVLHSATPAVAH
eukprot:923878-Amphidinium_carterae.1